MSPIHDPASRRKFLGDVGRLASVAALPTAAVMQPDAAHPAGAPIASAPGDWDLSWIPRLSSATDRAVFDWPTMGNPADPTIFQLAGRYLDNCAEVYPAGSYDVRVVFNVRTQAVPVALTDETWSRFNLGAEYDVKDPYTQQHALRNPFWHRAPSPVADYVMPVLGDFFDKGGFCLVCDFALGHLARRLAAKAGTTVEQVHAELRAGFLPNAYAVPSGIFGLARAQNAGCAYMRF